MPVFSGAVLFSSRCPAAGYPADKPQHTAWSASCQGTQLDAASGYNVVRHSCDSTYGQSGSPMYSSEENVRVILTGGNGHGLNWGTQVRRSKYRMC